VPGDDPRRIHWLASARFGTDTLLIRQSTEPVEPLLVVVLDTDPAPFGEPDSADAFETAVDLCMSIVRAAQDPACPRRSPPRTAS
jgi:uncharacterized protein (DUF58 family)